jgi:hypothetical protein
MDILAAVNAFYHQGKIQTDHIHGKDGVGEIV